MASAYHPFYGTLWDDDKLEGASFEGKAFFAYLFTNHRVRPSGIYRVTDAQLAADTGLPAARVKGYLADLQARRLIVRDGAWVFVAGYFKRQPKHDNLLKAVQSDIVTCSSVPILHAINEKYPRLNQWVADRLATVMVTVEPCTASFGSTEQLQSNAEQCRAEQGTVTRPCEPLPGPSSLPLVAKSLNGPSQIVFQISGQILAALERVPKLGVVQGLRRPEFWQAEFRANPGVDWVGELFKAEAYLTANPDKRYKRLEAFFHNWLAHADRPPQGEA